MSKPTETASERCLNGFWNLADKGTEVIGMYLG